MQLASALDVAPERAMVLFYGTTIGAQLHDPKYGYQLMSDTYIVNDLLAELKA